MKYTLFLTALLLGAVPVCAADAPVKALPLPGETFTVAGCTAFLIPGKTSEGAKTVVFPCHS